MKKGIRQLYPIKFKLHVVYLILSTACLSAIDFSDVDFCFDTGEAKLGDVHRLPDGLADSFPEEADSSSST